METIINALKTGLSRDLFSQQYYETINNLVAYDSELDYKNSDKIPTVLSTNPCQYEQRLRKLVLDLYSDKEPGVLEKGEGDVNSMEQNTRVHMNAAAPTLFYSIVKQQTDNDYLGPSSQGSYLDADDVTSPAILYRYQETALTNKGPDYVSPSPIDTVPYLADGITMNTGIQQAPYVIDRQQRLRAIASGSVGEDMTRPRHDSMESEVLARSFSDSGIQLEFELDEESTRYFEPFKQRDEFTQKHSDAAEYDKLKSKNISGHQIKRQSRELPSSHPTQMSVVLASSSTPIKTSSQQPLQNQDKLLTQPRSTNQQNIENEMSIDESYNYKLQLANMVGKLETLTTEYTEVLEERKQLSHKLQVYENRPEDQGIDGPFLEKPKYELQQLREKEQNLEKSIATLQKINNEKDIKVKDVEEKLHYSQLSVQNLQENLKTLEGEMISKSEGVQTLKNELKKLTCALEESKNCYETSFKENAMLSSDISTLMKAKSWLMKQLEVSEESQMKLQLELSEYQSGFLTQNRQVEELKCDNAKIAQQLSETQENAINEKAIILGHLEKVEKDLMSQDATLLKIQTEKNTIQRELAVKIESLQDENILLQNIAQSAQTLSEELKTLRIDADEKEALLNQLSEDKEEIYKQLTQARNLNKTCEMNIQNLNSKIENNEKKLANLALEKEDKDSIIVELQRKNTFLTESIQEAQEEKEGLDTAVQMLRLELDKVERRFKMMKRDLALKSSQLEEVTKQKDTFISELSFLREELEHHKGIMEELRDTIKQRDETIQTLQLDKAKVQAEARALSENLKQSKLNFDKAHKENELLFEKLQTSNGKLSDTEKKFYESCSQKALLEGELESTKQALQDCTTIKKAEQESLQQKMEQLQSALQCETTRHRDEAISLKQEVDLMKGKLVQQGVQYKSHTESLQKKIINIESTNVKDNENIKKHYDNVIREISKKAESEMDQRSQEIETLNQEKQSLAMMCKDLEQKARDAAAVQQNTIDALEKELQRARRLICEQKKELENQLMISIELERERGRLSGLKTSQKALREHCSSVEKLSAITNSKISELQSQLDLVSREKEREEKEAFDKINLLEHTARNQSETIEELRNQLVSERRDSSQLKIKLNESEREAEHILKKLTKTCVEVEHINTRYENCTKELHDSKCRERDYQERLLNTKMLVQNLELDTNALKERENIKDDILKSLEWKVKQRSKELEYAKEQLRLSSERHHSEIETLKTAIQVANSEAAYLRKEVSIARKAKNENQEKYFKARDELVAAKQESEVSKQDLFAAAQQLRYLKTAILNSLDVTELQEFVKHKADGTSFVAKVPFTEPANDLEFKSSLSSLRNCMTSLRSQISTLQEQMNNHTSMICSNGSSWKSFEKNVQSLQLEFAAVQRKAHSLSPGNDDEAI